MQNSDKTLRKNVAFVNNYTEKNIHHISWSTKKHDNLKYL